MKVKGLHLIVVAAVLALVAQADATNYLVNGDMETHWGHTPVLNLQYTGPGADCRINVAMSIWTLTFRTARATRSSSS